MQQGPRRYLVLLPIALALLLLAAWAGLVRMGWPWPLPARLVLLHGPVVIGGFFGTVIGLERAVAIARPWAYGAPAGAALGTLLLASGLAPLPGIVLLIAAGVVLCAVYVVAYGRQPAPFTAVMGLGAASWLAANLLYATGQPTFVAALWWMGFLVLTIAGERLELSRMRPPNRHRQAVFLVLVGVYTAALLLSIAAYDAGTRALGLATLGLALWLWQNDIATVTIRQRGLTRFIAAGLLSGYVWLTVGGLLLLVYGGQGAGLLYDAQLHAVFVGFVFSMIFAHAPIILPAVSGRAVAYSPVFYSHLALLHASLVVRIAGDLLALPAVRGWGGLFNAIAIVLFLLNTIQAVRRGRKATAAA
ncbi:MAG: hypothetical protein C0P61_010360 [Bacillota bacterium]